MICDCPEGFAGKQCQIGNTHSTHTAYTMHECSTVYTELYNHSSLVYIEYTIVCMQGTCVLRCVALCGYIIHTYIQYNIIIQYIP